MTQTLTPKDPAESFAVSFDFSRLLETVTAANVTAAIASGKTGAPEAILNGAAQVIGTQVLQRVSGGQVGSDYLLRCEASDGTETYVLTALMPVRTAGS